MSSTENQELLSLEDLLSSNVLDDAIEIPGIGVGIPVSPTPSEASGQTLQVFHPFQRLVKEIRLKIWREAMVPRVLYLDFPVPVPVPSVLHVNAESREEARKYYHFQLVFSPFSEVFRYYNCELDTFVTDVRHPSQRISGPRMWKRNFFMGQKYHVAIFTSALRSTSQDSDTTSLNAMEAALMTWHRWNTRVRRDEWESLTIIWNHDVEKDYFDLEGTFLVEDVKSKAASQFRRCLDWPVEKRNKRQIVPDDWIKPNVNFAWLHHS